MQKVITVFDGQNFSETAIDFVTSYPSVKKPLLVGVFLSSTDYSTKFDSISMAGTLPPVIEDIVQLSENIKRFKSLCERNYIDNKVHNDTGDEALERLRNETIFADLLIICSEHFYKRVGEDQSVSNMKNILESTECPVLLLPDHFDFPTRNILAYDGSEMSVYAIKQFSYVFPEFRGYDTMLIYASAQDEDIPDEGLIEELAAHHFNGLHLHKLDLAPDRYFNTWLTGRNNAILVAGGYSRKGIFSIFHKNFMSETIAEHKMPVFIAHK